MRGIDQHTSPKKWIVVHGHFYQPPRENPWLDVIEKQESAAPFHDWNERIYSQCYRPNAYSRLLDQHGMITGISNNYDFLSFNFGPTLLSWLAEHHPVTCSRIVEGDRAGSVRCNGHGNAVAQVYNHIIMPLASRRDKLTQIRWAKASFKRTFKREAKGIWLAETAINMETVECLVEEKISFVIMSPNQAEALRPLKGHAPWHEVQSGAVIDTRRPYRLFVTDAKGKRKGGSIDIFFFDEQLSKDISFNGLLQDAHVLGERIKSCYSPHLTHDEVVVVATDGETFGHHKPFGDMCLAYFFHHVAPKLGITPINFEAYRALHPPEFEVSLKSAFGEGTAWSCAHGVGRWIRDCGCNTGGEADWNQKWRTPLRQSLIALQARLDTTYTDACTTSSIDPWELRDHYTDRVRTLSFDKWKAAVAKQFPGAKVRDEKLTMLRRLLEAQRYMLYSFTSCGWFFSEISGIEPMQNLAYACRALQLGIGENEQESVLERFLAELSHAHSNIGHDTGATLFSRHILPYFHHNQMVAFVVAIEQQFEILSGSTMIKYGYQCSVDPFLVNKKTASSDAQAVVMVTIKHERYSKEDHFAVVLETSDVKNPNGWVAPVGEIRTVEDIKNHPLVKHYTLSGIFTSLRQDFAAIYRQKVDVKSSRAFSQWFATHKTELLRLTSLDDHFSEHYSTSILWVIQNQWDELFKQGCLADKARQLLDDATLLQELSQQYQVTIDTAYSANCCEKVLMTELEKMKIALTAVQCDTICTLMDLVDRFKLPVSKHRLEDVFYPVLTSQVRELHREVVTATKKNNADKKRALLIKILKFAHRLNFNVDAFPLI